MIASVMVGVGGAGASGVLTAALTSGGLRQLAAPHRSLSRLPLVGAVIGGMAGAAMASAAYRSDEWRLLPALVIWACVLVAAGLCDATTKRIPTVLVRAGALVVTVLFTIGLVINRDWQGLVLTAVASAASGATMLVCWRFLGAGFGDVRLALLGGLGLGWTDGRGLLLGFLVFALVLGFQAVGRRSSELGTPVSIPLGPALAAGFIAAAIA